MIVNSAFRPSSINSLFMPRATRTPPGNVSARQLFDWFQAGRENRGRLRQAGYSDGRITNWRVRGIPRGEVGAVAKLMGLSYEDYLIAAGEQAPTGAHEPSGNLHNVEEGPPIRAKVPLISWTSAGRWTEARDPRHRGDGDEWVLTTAKVGPNAFALRIVGDSMEPRIPDGSIVIIDPARSYQHGSIVLAKRSSDQEATLKQLWYDGAEPKLRPLNSRYPILDMPKDAHIIGVAVRVELDL